MASCPLPTSGADAPPRRVEAQTEGEGARCLAPLCRLVGADEDIGVFVVEEGVYKYANRAFARMLGSPLADVVGREFRDVHATGVAPGLAARLARSEQGDLDRDRFETRWTRPGAEPAAVRVNLVSSPVQGGRATSGTLIDITLEERLGRELRSRTETDPLTGLPNPTHFLLVLAEVLARCRAEARLADFAVLFIGVDDFRLVNDSLGRARGDELLVSMANLLRSYLKPGDALARQGGAHFSLLLDHLDGQDAVATAHGILATLRHPFLLGGRDVFASASIGVALGHPGYATPDDVVQDAEMALSEAKANRATPVLVFDAGMREDARTLLSLETDLRTAVVKHELRCYLQPTVNPVTGRITGFEALLRWQHPTRGLLAPDSFLHVAEDTGLLVEMGWWILGAACGAVAEIRARRPEFRDADVAVNLSQRQLLDPDLEKRVRTSLDETGLPASALRLEITESVLMRAVLAGRPALDALRSLGVRLDLDDFGTGYSSLSYVGSVPLHGIKVDRRFVQDVPEDGRAVALLRAIAKLIGSLRLEGTIEGVETESQAGVIRRLGFKRAQGYLWGRPGPTSDYLDASADAQAPSALQAVEVLDADGSGN